MMGLSWVFILYVQSVYIITFFSLNFQAFHSLLLEAFFKLLFKSVENSCWYAQILGRTVKELKEHKGLWTLVWISNYCFVFSPTIFLMLCQINAVLAFFPKACCFHDHAVGVMLGGFTSHIIEPSGQCQSNLIENAEVWEIIKILPMQWGKTSCFCFFFLLAIERRR